MYSMVDHTQLPQPMMKTNTNAANTLGVFHIFGEWCNNIVSNVKNVWPILKNYTVNNTQVSVQ